MDGTKTVCVSIKNVMIHIEFSDTPSAAWQHDLPSLSPYACVNEQAFALYLWECHRSLFFDLGDFMGLDYTHIINKFNQPTRTMSSS